MPLPIPLDDLLLALGMARWIAINGTDAEKRGEFARPATGAKNARVASLDPTSD